MGCGRKKRLKSNFSHHPLSRSAPQATEWELELPALNPFQRMLGQQTLVSASAKTVWSALPCPAPARLTCPTLPRAVFNLHPWLMSGDILVLACVLNTNGVHSFLSNSLLLLTMLSDQISIETWMINKRNRMKKWTLSSMSLGTTHWFVLIVLTWIAQKQAQL